MQRNNSPEFARQSTRFLYLYALAVAGGSVAYVPLLTILLPLHVNKFAGAGALTLLSYIAFAGAVSASVANIAFGWASDISKSRRGWICAGLLLSSALLLAIPRATEATAIILLIVCWQLALNMMLAPLLAWAGDVVPDAQKGMLGGLMAFAPAMGALSGALVTTQGLIPESDRLFWVAMFVLILVTPVLVFGKPADMPQLMHVRDGEAGNEAITQSKASVWRMWIARLLVQIAEASLFAFLLIWFRSIEQGFGENRAAAIFAFVLGAAVLFALYVGRWSDRHNRPIAPLVVCSGIAALGLMVMSIADDLVTAIAGYVAFGLSSSIFLALHSSQTLRVLPKPGHRGRDLGFFNLTNTVPSLIMPWLTLALVPVYGFGALFLLLALLAAIACWLLIRMPE